MRRAAKALGVWLSGLVVSIAQAGPPTMPTPLPASLTTSAPTPLRVDLGQIVTPEFRESVLKVIRNPTLSTSAIGEEVVCTVAVYEWLYAHPDRVALAWQRLKIPSVAITPMGGGKFAWTDENGSEVVWQTVGTFPDGLVWYATGKIKAARATPAVPVQGVVVVCYPKKFEKDGVALFAPTVQCYMHSDSRAANLILRMLGPAGPRVAEDAAGQLLEFFSGIAAYVQKHPNQAETLLGPARK